MWPKVAEKFGAVVDGAISITIESEPCVVGVVGGPSELFGAPDVVEIEVDAVGCVG